MSNLLSCVPDLSLYHMYPQAPPTSVTVNTKLFEKLFISKLIGVALAFQLFTPFCEPFLHAVPKKFGFRTRSVVEWYH